MSGNCVGHLRMGAEPDLGVVPVETVPAEQLPPAVPLGPSLRGRLRPREGQPVLATSKQWGGSPLPCCALHSLAERGPQRKRPISLSWSCSFAHSLLGEVPDSVWEAQVAHGQSPQVQGPSITFLGFPSNFSYGGQSVV